MVDHEFGTARCATVSTKRNPEFECLSNSGSQRAIDRLALFAGLEQDHERERSANETVGHRKIEGSNVWKAVQQLTETAERIRGTRALVPRGVQRFATFEAHEWMLEMIASTHVSRGRKISRKSAPP
jgi:hypothetical protein